MLPFWFSGLFYVSCLFFCFSCETTRVWPTSPYIHRGYEAPTTSWATSLCTPSSPAGRRASWFPSGGFTWFSPGRPSPCIAWGSAAQPPRPRGTPQRRRNRPPWERRLPAAAELLLQAPTRPTLTPELWGWRIPPKDKNRPPPVERSSDGRSNLSGQCNKLDDKGKHLHDDAVMETRGFYLQWIKEVFVRHWFYKFTS